MKMGSGGIWVGCRRSALAAGVAVWCTAVFLAAWTGDEVRETAPVAPMPAAVQAAIPRVQATAPARVNYETEIKPLIEANCFDCHSQDRRKGGLSLATYADLLDGGKDGPVVRPGNGSGSMMVERLHGIGGEQMPKDAAPLSAAEVALVQRWIDEGARRTPTSAAAPAPWDAPLGLSAPAVPARVWTTWSAPADRIVAAYLRDRRVAEPAVVGDAVFARRAYLDLWGLLPTPDELSTFLADRTPGKRAALVSTLLADSRKYAEHWVSFWNDLLRNDDGVNYYSETAGRRSITPWLLPALYSNLPYDQFVRRLLNPVSPADPEGFLTGVNWRGETSAAVTPWAQAAQNTAQVFLGVNLKCNACHDSFVNKWKLADAYGLASFFSPEGRLQLFRCDIAQDGYAEPAFLYPELNRTPPSPSLADRRATIAAIFTDPRNGRLARTVVNRIWQRLLGHGIVASSDEMDGRPWSPVLLDWLASDFVSHGYDLKHLIATIVNSRAYQLPAVARTGEAPARDYGFGGPEVRRLTAEQWSDAIGAITGDWTISTLGIARLDAAPAPISPGGGRGGAGGVASGGRSGGPAPSDVTTAGTYVREWRAPSSNLTRALGRPIRDQVTSTRAVQSTTPQALELVNGDIVNERLVFGARRLLGQLAPEPESLYNKAIGGRTARPVSFDVDVAAADRLWLIVQETGSNEPARVLPVWAATELVTAAGVATPIGQLTPLDRAGLRPGSGPVVINGTAMDVLRAANPSRLVYDIAGRGFVRLRGTMFVENAVSDIGATLDPQLRFFVFSREPNADRLLPPTAGAPLPAVPVVTTAAEAVTRVFRHALGRAPNANERRTAEAALRDPVASSRLSAEGLADLIWAVLVKPEFQLIY